jgi:serine/threonine protein phosphatase PrpC
VTRVVSASISFAGGRAENQDRAGDLEADGARVFAVADGLGGHAGGARASTSAVRAILERFRQEPGADAKRLESIFFAAQEAIRRTQHEDPSIAGCRTTAVVLLEERGSALWGHVGDTRLYLLRDGRVAHQTLDHSVPQALASAGEIEPEDIRRHPDRNRLLRALGGDEDPTPTLPEGGHVQLRERDVFLMCTDGFWEYVTEADMEETLARASSPDAWLAVLEERLLARATGAFDNYTATAVFFDRDRIPPSGAAAPERAIAERAREDDEEGDEDEDEDEEGAPTALLVAVALVTAVLGSVLWWVVLG